MTQPITLTERFQNPVVWPLIFSATRSPFTAQRYRPGAIVIDDPVPPDVLPADSVSRMVALAAARRRAEEAGL